ncbi:unnamed protein product [Brugia timori]|uniref:Uncharacterized protein n=1 Tax=Brugia timori TaxID=42155 RepID=A0A0R3Q9R5_9BILA|nr:unnamed protein product [Brugia timori]
MSSVVQRRSRRLQEKNKVELDDKSWTTTDLLSSSVANYSKLFQCTH